MTFTISAGQALALHERAVRASLCSRGILLQHAISRDDSCEQVITKNMMPRAFTA